MIHAALGGTLFGFASPANFNNDIGLPLSLLRAQSSHDYGVVELGASRPGEIARLANMCRPDISVITAIGDAHLAGFGDRRRVANSKAELLDATNGDGLAVLPGDDPWARRVADRFGGRVVWFGRGGECEVMAQDVRASDGRLRFRIDNVQFEIAAWGRHFLGGALAAFAVAREFGLSTRLIASALAAYRPPPMRCRVRRVNGVTWIDDTYNANPTSMRAALELLRDFDTAGRRWFVCGEMAELGPSASSHHRQLGQQIVTVCGADWLLACGAHRREVIPAAREAGMPAELSFECEDIDDAYELLAQQVEPGDVVLVKGSRVAALDELVARFDWQPDDVNCYEHMTAPATSQMEKLVA